MSTTLRQVNVRRSLAVAALVLSAPVLSSCGVNFDAQTDQVYQPAEGTNALARRVDVLNALVVSGTEGSGTVIATLVNNNPTTADTLQSVAGAKKDASLQVTPGGPSTIPATGMLNLAEKGRIFAKSDRIKAGYIVYLTFTFANADPVTLPVPVVKADRPVYDGVPLPPSS